MTIDSETQHLAFSGRERAWQQHDARLDADQHERRVVGEQQARQRLAHVGCGALEYEAYCQCGTLGAYTAEGAAWQELRD